MHKPEKSMIPNNNIKYDDSSSIQVQKHVDYSADDALKELE